MIESSEFCQKKNKVTFTCINFIGGEFVAPKSGEYFDVISPVDGKIVTKVAHATLSVSGSYTFRNSYS